MKGVVVRKITKVHEDERRGIYEIMNGEMGIRNLKILKVTEDSFLGGTAGHWHQYGEVMHILEGEATDYFMENLDTGEKEVFNLVKGDVVFRTGRIVHGGNFKKGTIVIDGACEMYIDGNYNDIVDKPSHNVVGPDGLFKMKGVKNDS